MLDFEDKDSIDTLFEYLSLQRLEVEPMTPPFTGYGPSPKYWDWYGGPWPVRKNPKNYRDIEYRNFDGKLHRIYGPAYISKRFNVQAWFNNGKRHRENGPAYIHNDNEVWFYEDQLHRLDGPAVVERGGPKQYWIHGQKYSPKEYKKEIARRKRKGLIK